MKPSPARIRELLRHKKRMMEHYPHAVEWRKHLGFTRPMALNAKREFNSENAMIREYMLAAMKQWCRANIPDEGAKHLPWEVQIPWCFFENKFRFKFENHKMAFVMEFRRKGDDLKQEARDAIAQGHIKIRGS